MESLEKIFSLDDYTHLVEQIQERVLFTFKVKSGNLEFIFYFEECNNGLWKDGLIGRYYATYKTAGVGVPFQIDKIPTYKEICEAVNKVIEWVVECEDDK